ncbi:MAG TPA: hypothetical protein VG652_07650 [Gaiellaceae bacterium]|nr:hypothetical protein [Gaiellaceae bacterium]
MSAILNMVANASPYCLLVWILRSPSRWVARELHYLHRALTEWQRVRKLLVELSTRSRV